MSLTHLFFPGRSQLESFPDKHGHHLRHRSASRPETLTDVAAHQELLMIHVKWDSERKRRQGYFTQEEGAEKSPFRHYNKANCDFES